MSDHHCHAEGCIIKVPPEMLMCRRHWFLVHPILRRHVWNTYRPGQCDDMQPSEAWHRAADGAIGYVALKEKRPVTKAQMEALEHFRLAPATREQTLELVRNARSNLKSGA